MCAAHTRRLKQSFSRTPGQNYRRRAGYYVRTRADADTKEARAGDYSRWRAALISGAQIISTDYYVPDARLGTGYCVKLPGGQPGRWNILLLPNDRPLPPLETVYETGANTSTRNVSGRIAGRLAPAGTGPNAAVDR